MPALDQIRERLPGFHQGYHLIQQSVETAFSPLGSSPESWPIDAFPIQDRSRVVEFYDVLQQVRAWQARVQSGQTLQRGAAKPSSDWKIMLDLWQAETAWFGQILPTMTKIKQKQWSSLELPKNVLEPDLLNKLPILRKLPRIGQK